MNFAMNAALLFLIVSAFVVNTNGKSTSQRKKRQIISSSSKLWDLSQPMKMYISSAFTSYERDFIELVLDQLEERTCIRTEHSSKDVADVYIARSSSSCSSPLGMNTPQDGYYTNRVKLMGLCVTTRDILHEIMHTLGVDHEMKREDRDKYMKFDPNYFTQDIADSDFAKDSDLKIENPFDLTSAMLYKPGIYSSDSIHLDMSAVGDNAYTSSMGQNFGLSFFDIKNINDLYCKNVCPDAGACSGLQSYRNPNNCQECLCMDGLAGDDCNELAPSDESCGTQDVYEATSDGETIVTYVAQLEKQKCNFKISKTNEDKALWYAVTTTNMLPSDVFSDVNICGDDWIDVRQEDQTAGKRYCGASSENFEGFATEDIVVTIRYNNLQLGSSSYIEFMEVPLSEVNPDLLFTLTDGDFDPAVYTAPVTEATTTPAGPTTNCVWTAKADETFCEKSPGVVYDDKDECLNAGCCYRCCRTKKCYHSN